MMLTLPKNIRNRQSRKDWDTWGKERGIREIMRDIEECMA